MNTGTQITKPNGIAVLLSGTPENDQPYIEAMRASGFEVVTCSDPHTFTNIIDSKPRGWKPTVFIVDVIIPRLSGFEVVKSLQRNVKNKDIPIVMMSQYCSKEDKYEAANAGASAVIAKPIVVDELLAALESHQTNKEVKV